MSTADKKKLNSGAKAFVPGSFLTTSAKPWAPPKEDGTNTAEPPVAVVTTSKKAPTKKSNDKQPSASDTKKSDKKPTEVKKDEPTMEKKPAPAPTPAPPKPSAWGKKPSNAILTAPAPDTTTTTSKSQPQQSSSRPQRKSSHRNKSDEGKGQWRNQKNDNNNNNGGGGGGSWRNQKKGDDDRGGRGGGRHHNRHDKNHHKNDDGNSADGWSRGKALPLELLKPNEGKNEGEKAVGRIVVEELLSLRLSFLAAPLVWTSEDAGEDVTLVGPPPECRWTSDTRLTEIDTMTNAKRLGGDVSFRKKKRQENDTAPALEDCKPLEVNDQTRWKAGVFKKDGKDVDGEDTDEQVLKMSLLILNKLSLTKFDKLSDAFIETGIGRNANCLAGAIELIVKKAQDEQHFAAMYAALCLKLSRTPMDFEEPGKKKKFKKMLLTECQKEFEQDTETKIAKALAETEDEEDGKNKAILVKKQYLGHMRFIGELYKGNLISIKIMLTCLPALLEGELSSAGKEGTGVDEENVECFAKLMTVIGMSLEQQSVALKNNGKPDAFESLGNCWKTVEIMAGKRKEEGPKVSNRIKFMLQDLIEMRDNGWVQRREEESAKTIAQIHKEAAKDLRRSSSRNNLNKSASSSNIRRQSSTNDVLNIARHSAKPSVDSEGFTEIGNARGFGRSKSMGNFARNDSRSNLRKSEKSKSSSSGGSFAAFNKVASSPRRESQKAKSKDALPNVDEKKASSTKQVVYKTPDECGQKAKNYLKEYFVGGDTDDIVLSLHELIGAGAEGSIARGTKVIQGGVMLVLEMKAEHVDKFLTVITRCISEKKIEHPSVIDGLNDPLEFLGDIAIDAPLATSHMVAIVSKMIESGAATFDFLLNAPAYFLSDGGAAQFGCKVIKKIGGDAISSQANLDVIEKLMTDMDKTSFPSGAKEMLS